MKNKGLVADMVNEAKECVGSVVLDLDEILLKVRQKDSEVEKEIKDFFENTLHDKELTAKTTSK